ncbi:hypothetical protein KKG45_08425, partial [bacterium]|nr:hypothetical protein [bacterium]
AHQVAQGTGRSWPWADAWLDDLLCLPLVLSLALALHRRLRVRDARYVLPAAQVAAAWLFVCVVFEVALPALDAGFTADPLDAAAYAAGALLFQLSLNRGADRSPGPEVAAG